MKFNATSRSVQGSSASRRLRHAGRVPAIVYGGEAKPLNIDLDHNEIFHALRKEEFHASILDMQLDGGKGEQVLLRSVQWHAYKQQVLHVDFQRVSANQALTTKVPLHFINEEACVGVKMQGGTLTKTLTEVEISCLPANLPEYIEVDMLEIESGTSVHLSDLIIGEGVSIVALAFGSDRDIPVASVTAKRGGGAELDDEDAPEADAPAADDAEEASDA